jgi:hypothetical protein
VQEAVEEHQGVGSGRVELPGHVSSRAEVRAELYRHRHGDRVLHGLQYLHVAPFDVAAGDVRPAGKVVDVELDGCRSGFLNGVGVGGPSARRDAVEAGDDRYMNG